MEVAAAGWGYLFEQNYEKGVSMIDYRDYRLLRLTLFWECNLFKKAKGKDKVCTRQFLYMQFQLSELQIDTTG